MGRYCHDGKVCFPAHRVDFGNRANRQVPGNGRRDPSTLANPEAKMGPTPRPMRSWILLLATVGFGAWVSYCKLQRPEIEPTPAFTSDGWVYEQEASEKTARNAMPAEPHKATSQLPELPGSPIPASVASMSSFSDVLSPADASGASTPPRPTMTKVHWKDVDILATLPPGVERTNDSYPEMLVAPGIARGESLHSVATADVAGPANVLDLPDAPTLPLLPELTRYATLPGGVPLIGEVEEKRAPIDRPIKSRPQLPIDTPIDVALPYRTPMDRPIGYAGKSGILPRDTQRDPRFYPVEDRWRIGFPEYDRYGKGHPRDEDYLYQPGDIRDPYRQNVLKGDYPILGQHTFLELTATSRSIIEPRQLITQTTPFESTRRPFSEEFFGNPNQLSYQQFFLLSFDLFHGDTAFRPMDWRVKVTPVFNMNYITLQEVAQVNPDVRRGAQRGRTFLALQEWFVETKLADLGPNYDFVSARVGSQFFNSDFRGFIFTDTNRAARIFGTRNSNRQQFNLIYFAQLEKDTNSELNTFRDRDQGVLIGNYFLQDFIWPGYTAQFSFHYNHDEPSFHFDRNRVLVRPDPVGVAQPHGLDVMYLGWTGDGHINRINVNHAFYYAFGRDSLNPIANRGQDISAGMGALELSYDRDYIRFRSSVFWASGDDNPRNGHACGFDAILDNPNFAGGEFSYWQRQSIRLFGVNLVNRQSLVPNLRSSKLQGQSNFVNPGLYLANLGMDIEFTPRFRMVNNANFLWFDNTAVLKQFVYANKVDQAIGTDLSVGFEYRPFLNNNAIVRFGASSLLPSQGFYDLYNNLRDATDPLVAGFVDIVLTY